MTPVTDASDAAAGPGATPARDAVAAGAACRRTRAGLLAALLLTCAAPPDGLRAQGGPTSQAPPSGQTTPPSFEEEVEVVGVTPLPGMTATAEQLPAPIQTATSQDLDASGALNLADFLNRRATAVHINDIQGNPFQVDVSYRGYTASPLLGTPQGLSVFMDGVRMNQPFGEVVSWDLIPRMAIASSTIMPGSNPLFGLNTLGGSLVLQTKDGLSHKGTSVQALYGQFARRAVEIEHGGARQDGSLHWYVAGSLFGEDGWREASPSDVRQLFAKVGWQRRLSALTLSAAHADNALNGNGLQESRFLARDHASVYTRPDETDNRATLLSATLRHAWTDRLGLTGNAYVRRIRTSTLNGDVNEGSLDQALYQPSANERAALIAAGYTNVPVSGASAATMPFPFLRCVANVLLRDEPGEKCNGLNNRAQAGQSNGGLSAQVNWQHTRGRAAHQVVAGAAFDRSAMDFTQTSELGYVLPDRSIFGTGVFADGASAGDVDGEPFDLRVGLDGVQRTWSAYAADTMTIARDWHVTISGRFNRTSLENRDRIQPGGGPGSLDGNHAFARFNPAAGLTYNPTPALNAYAGYGEGSRAATSVELGCADPASPCKLPNAMAGDPPLRQVVTRTVEAGLRGRLRQRTHWNAGFFHAENRNDILFVASESTGFGYFKNFGRTRRTGLELGVRSHVGTVTVGAGYNWLAATFQSEEVVNGTGNSSNDDAVAGNRGLESTIEIEPGDRIPLIPRHTFKAYVDWTPTRALSVDLNVIAVGGSLARGNENGEHEPDGLYYLGPGEADGYAVANLAVRYRLTSKLQLFVQVNNLLEAEYVSAAQLGSVAFTPAGTFVARPFPAVAGEFPVQQGTFFAPGSPRTVIVGTRVSF